MAESKAHISVTIIVLDGRIWLDNRVRRNDLSFLGMEFELF